MSFLMVQSLFAGYRNNQILQDCSFGLEKGSITGVLGANGSGKTTLLKAVCGILPHHGTCTLDGTVLESLSVRKLAGLCGYIPQRSGIGIDLPVIDVVLMGFHARLGILEHPNAAMRREASAALRTVGLGGMEEQNYLHLSEGQKQLCIFARTLVSGCKLLLLDEPESALDFRYRYRMLELLRQRVSEEQGCALVALHDPALALNCCDRLLFLSGGSVAGMVSPGEDPLQTEKLLQTVYGPVSLMRGISRGGREQWMMLRDREPETDGIREGGAI